MLRRLSVGVVLALVCSSCTEPTEPPRPPVTTPDTTVTIVNLNAAMGYEMGAGEPGGTDPTPEDLEYLADDILKQNADIANLQEMAKPAAEHLRGRLADRTGHKWELNWVHSGHADYRAGRAENEEPEPGYRGASSGNAQLVRIGDGIRSQEPITVDCRDDDQGIILPSGGRSFGGARIVTERGVLDVYVTHLGREKDGSDEMRARDVERLQLFTEARTAPAVVTGDFNQVIDEVQGEFGHPHQATVGALQAFMTRYGYTDVARDKGPTSNQKKKDFAGADVPLIPQRIDFILARGVSTVGTARFESRESDHWGLVTTIDPGSTLPAATPKPATRVDPAFLGEWRSPAPVDQPSAPDSEYHVELTLCQPSDDVVVGETFYPELQCRGALTLVSAAPDAVVLREDIISDPQPRCIKQGTVTVRSAAGKLTYSYVGSGGTAATADLQRK